MAFSDCAQSQSLSRDCRDSNGGIQVVYIGSKNDVASYTYASGTVTALTMSQGKKFWTYEQNFATATASDDINPNAANGALMYLHKLLLKIMKRTALTGYELRKLAIQDIVAIVKDQNDDLWVLGGDNGIRMIPSPASFGTNLDDMNGYEVNFEGQEREAAQKLPSNMLAALLAPAV